MCVWRDVAAVCLPIALRWAPCNENCKLKAKKILEDWRHKLSSWDIKVNNFKSDIELNNNSEVEVFLRDNLSIIFKSFTTWGDYLSEKNLNFDYFIAADVFVIDQMNVIIARPSPALPINPEIPIEVSIIVQVSKVSLTDKLKYSLKSQNPLSLI